MIHVDRANAPDGFEEEAVAELKQVLEHFERSARVDGHERAAAELDQALERSMQPGDFKFGAYKAAGVAETLIRLFNGKCAYCESKFEAVHPVEVEHYRPKGAVVIEGKKSKPGYYWLAARWDNLLASCIFCNRLNHHEIAVELPGGEPGPDLKRKLGGKGSHFPLEDERARARRSKHDVLQEAPLLLDPCGMDDPRAHLLFSDNGWVEPRRNGAGAPSRRGMITIDVLALRRESLVAARRERAMRILGDLRLIEELEDEAAVNPALRNIADERKSLFTRYLDPAQPYLAMTMDLLDEGGTGLLAEVEALRAALERNRSREPAAGALKAVAVQETAFPESAEPRRAALRKARPLTRPKRPAARDARAAPPQTAIGDALEGRK